MTKKEYLSQAFNLYRRIKRKEARINAKRASIGAYSNDPEEVKVRSLPHSPFEADLLRVIQLEEEVSEERKKLEALKAKTWDAIRTIGNDNIEAVMESRYIDFLSWQEIADNLGYSLSYTYALHGKGLALIRISA